MNRIVRCARAAGRLCWKVLVGDTPEIGVAVAVVVAAAFALRHEHWLAVIGLPLLVALVLIVSSARAARANR
jgi:hypothetical protein